MELGQIFPEGRIAGFQFDGLLQPRQCVAKLALAPQDQTQVGVGNGQVRVQPQGFEIGRPRIDESLQRTQHVAEVVMQSRHVRLQTDGFLAMRQGFFGLAAIQQHLTEVGPSRGKCWIEFDGATKVR